MVSGRLGSALLALAQQVCSCLQVGQGRDGQIYVSQVTVK